MNNTNNGTINLIVNNARIVFLDNFDCYAKSYLFNASGIYITIHTINKDQSGTSTGISAESENIEMVRFFPWQQIKYVELAVIPKV